MASAGRRCGERVEDVAGAQRRAGRRRRERGGLGERPGRRAPARLGALDQAAADRARLGHDRQLRRAALRLGGVVGDERQAGARVDERARARRRTGGRSARRRRGSRRAPTSISRSRARLGERWPAKSGWSCGKPARAPKASVNTGHARCSARATSASQPSWVSAPAPTTRAGERGVVEPRRELLDRLGGRGAGVQQALGADDLVGLGRRRVPVVHRHDHERRAASGRGGVVGAHERARDVLRAHGLVDRYRVLARQAVQAAGEEGLLGQLAAVLLADHDHQRRAIDARGGERGDGVAEARRSCAAGRRPARRARARSRSPSRPRSPRAGPGRTRGRRAGRPGRRPRSSRGWRRSVVSPSVRRTSKVASRTVGAGGAPVACHRRVARGPHGLAWHRPAL